MTVACDDDLHTRPSVVEGKCTRAVNFHASRRPDIGRNRPSTSGGRPRLSIRTIVTEGRVPACVLRPRLRSETRRLSQT